MEDTKTRPIENKVVSRRMVFYYLGWGVMGIFLSAVDGSIIRFFFPRLLFEPPTKYKIGFLSEYTLGISERFKK
jgi:cytochrome b6-f complex iron-sulfur subunit